MTVVSPGDDYARRDILTQEGPRDLKIILIDVEQDFSALSGGLILGKKALTPSVSELSTIFCFKISSYFVLLHQRKQRSYFRL